MKKRTWIAIAMVFTVFTLLSGCAAVPATASVPQTASQTSAASAAVALNTTVQPTVTPVASASQTPEATPSTTPSASPSASASSGETAPWKVAVPYNLEQEKNSQKSVDAGHSPWRLDVISSVQSFVSIKMSPDGQVVGDFPIKEEDLRVTQMSDTDAVVAVSNEKSPITKVYLKRLVKQTEDGIWTVVGYDPK